jgi:hypothetical protein
MNEVEVHNLTRAQYLGTFDTLAELSEDAAMRLDEDALKVALEHDGSEQEVQDGELLAYLERTSPGAVAGAIRVVRVQRPAAVAVEPVT